MLDTAPDAELFVGRTAELARLRRSLDLGLNGVVVGPAGSGKSSLLRHLAWTVRSAKTVQSAGEPVIVTAAGAEDVAGLLRAILRRVAGDEAAAVAELARSGPPALLDRLRAVLPERSVVLVDDLGTEIGRGLFGALRDEVWSLGWSWVVASADGEADALLRPPVDVFFETVLRLGPLSDDDAADLLQRRGVDLPRKNADVLAELAGGVPRRLVDLARSVVVDGRAVDDLAAEETTRRVRLQGLGEPARALAAALADVGSASPSDVALQRRMGVSRPRLVALFAELCEAGVVVELPPDRSAGTPGRPRTRYALTGTVGGLRDAVRDDH